MEQSNEVAGKVENEEISLKELILKIQEWWRYLLSKWIVVGIFGLVGSGIGLTFALFSKPKYVGDLTFVLEESSKPGGLSSYAGVANQLGIDLSSMGGGTSGLFSGDNVIEFLKSRLMIEKTLLTPINVDGKELSLAEFYIEFNEMRNGWGPRLSDIHFPVNPDRKKFTLLQDSILNSMYEMLIRGNLQIAKPDKKLSFIDVQTTSRNELFSKIFTERLVDEATTFYAMMKTRRSKANVDILQRKADSIEILLNRKTYSAAIAQDLNMNPVKSQASVGTELVLRDKVVLQTMFQDVVKNLELSKLTMSQETPIIQIVDTPILPLKKEKLGKTKGGLIGGILGGFLTISVLLVRRIYKKIME
ncbi:lipopolysaccharide biosynthesis protein [Chitinophaga sancti]|uniref:lipopolysaccharide biosynthesis protein n=1 Tax=Chitinophaga sancti TaxID=1004 RepID=UPI002A7495C4|nr:lipopolysaccharide biosynthesis protein [Chitinophaga sancti]WPQ64517.1 lipopolysaccharide biosynthesis protein [Chitinophaga sancti]